MRSQHSGNSFQQVEKLTYNYYLTGNWDSLIIIGTDAISAGQDYFYLRLRLGIACYFKENYRKAIMHLEKALKFNSNDDTALEYLYYSYVYSNQPKQANALTTNSSKKLIEKLNTGRLNWLENLYLETGPTFSNNISKNKKNNLLKSNSDYGVQDLYDKTYYFHLGTGITPFKRVSFYLGYNNLNISKLKQIQSTELVLKGVINNGNAIHNLYRKKTSEIQNSAYSLFQKEAYINSGIALNNGFIITPAVHLIWAHYATLTSELSVQYYEVLLGDTLTTIKANTQEKEESFTNQVYSIAIDKSISLYNMGIRGSYSNLNYSDQYQLEGLFTVFPKGNLSLYSATSITSHWQEKANRIVFQELIGAKVFPKFWLEGHLSIGEMLNYNEKNAFVVYNSGDKIKFRGGINFIITLTPKLELSVRYSFYNNENSLYNYTPDLNLKIEHSDYQNHSIIGGLKWKL
ncbi:MAG: hypothetical protein R2764_05290 [Bacteroidales bacterium]